MSHNKTYLDDILIDLERNLRLEIDSSRINYKSEFK